MVLGASLSTNSAVRVYGRPSRGIWASAAPKRSRTTSFATCLRAIPSCSSSFTTPRRAIPPKHHIGFWRPQARRLEFLDKSSQGRPRATRHFLGNATSSDHLPSEQPGNRTSDHRMVAVTKRCVIGRRWWTWVDGMDNLDMGLWRRMAETTSPTSIHVHVVHTSQETRCRPLHDLHVLHCSFFRRKQCANLQVCKRPIPNIQHQ